MYGMLYVLAPARAGALHKLTCFTHFIDGQLYGGWYRVCSPTEVEVQAVGLLEVVSWEGRSPEGAAQWCLEQFVACRERSGIPTPVLDQIVAELQEIDPYSHDLRRHDLRRAPNGRRLSQALP